MRRFERMHPRANRRFTQAGENLGQVTYRPEDCSPVGPLGTLNGSDGFAHRDLQLQEFLPYTHFSSLEAIPLVFQPYALR